jgi:DNA-binding beta-propeller fold protein YncE
MTQATALREVEEWGANLPDLRTQDISDIGIGTDDNVFLLYRNPSFIVVCTPAGDVVRTIAEGILGPRAHGVTVTPDGLVYVVDSGAHRIRILAPDGSVIREFGSGPTNPAFARKWTGEYIDNVDRAYPPFCLPTRIAVSPSGEIFVSDGYGNCRIHHFMPDGDLVHSWGEPGTGPGQFNTPHDIFLDRSARILVCDRENDRIQVFGQDGHLLEQWTDLHRPQGVVQGPDNLYYVAEGAYRPGHVSPVHGTVSPEPSRVSVLADGGAVVERLGEESGKDGEPDAPDRFIAAHGITIDSAGGVYVAEVSFSVSQRFPRPGVHIAASKFCRGEH